MRKAFTLIELLVVISIIALLIAILLPVLSSARISARDIQDLANVRSFTQACLTWTADDKGKLPAGDPTNYGGSYVSMILATKLRLIDDYGVAREEFGCNSLESIRSHWNSFGLYKETHVNGRSVIGWNYYGGRKQDRVELIETLGTVNTGIYYVSPHSIEDVGVTSQTLATCMVYNAYDSPRARWESISPHSSPGEATFSPGGQPWAQMAGYHIAKLDGSAGWTPYQDLKIAELNDYIYYEPD